MKKIAVSVFMMMAMNFLQGCAGGGSEIQAPAVSSGGGQNMDYIYRSPSYQISHTHQASS